jgi:hypothetical protein
MDTDGHRFRGPDCGLALLCLGLLCDERMLAMGKVRSEYFLSVLICVHLWLN